MRDGAAMDEGLDRSMATFQRCIETRDRAAAEQVLDADYQLVLVSPARAVMPRERWLEVLPDYVVDEYVIEEKIVDVDGDCATVLHRARMKATVLGEDRSGVFIVSDVWRKRDGGWRVWRRHSTPLSAAPMPGASR